MNWNILITSHNLGNLFGRDIPIYGVCYMGGILLGGLLALLLAKKRHFDLWEIVYGACFAVIGGLLGAKLLSILTSLPTVIQYLRNGGSFYEVIKNGFVFYGGLLGGAGGLFIYTKAYRLSFGEYADFYAPSMAIGHAIGRVGCLFTGCCYGKQVSADFPLTVQYRFDDPTHISSAVRDAYYIPTQLIESVALLILFVACLVCFFKSRKKGLPTFVYAMGYSVLRFLLEFLRGDGERGVYFGFSTSQYISVLIFAFCLVLIIVRAVKKRKTA